MAALPSPELDTGQACWTAYSRMCVCVFSLECRLKCLLLQWLRVKGFVQSEPQHLSHTRNTYQTRLASLLVDQFPTRNVFSAFLQRFHLHLDFFLQKHKILLLWWWPALLTSIGILCKCHVCFGIRREAFMAPSSVLRAVFFQLLQSHATLRRC